MAKPVKCTESVMKKCKYATRFNSSGWMHCDYLCKTCERRGCPPEACNKFVARKVAMK